MKEIVYFSLGSNLGDRLDNIEAALGLLAGICSSLEASRVYETEPLHYRRQAKFLNAAARGRADISPERLVARLQKIERGLGRVRERRYGPRTIDIDILLFGKRVVDTAGLTIPHPRLRLRRFVLRPLLELAPGLTDPVSGDPYWKAFLAPLRGGVYFYDFSRYTKRSLIPLVGTCVSGRDSKQ